MTLMRDLKVTLYTWQIFDGNCASIGPKDEKFLPAIWCFCSSLEYNKAVRRIDQKLNVTNATLVKVPFDLDYWIKSPKKNTLMAYPSPTPTTRPSGSFMVIRPGATHHCKWR